MHIHEYIYSSASNISKHNLLYYFINYIIKPYIFQTVKSFFSTTNLFTYICLIDIGLRINIRSCIRNAAHQYANNLYKKRALF